MAPANIPKNFVRRVPAGDERERLVCETCDFIHYDNPRVIVGAVCTWDGRYLMCKRAIEPRKGYWTLPAGFLEIGEPAADGAAREAWEEARVRLEIDGLLAVYDVLHVAQVQLIYRARLATPDYAPGPESLEVELYDWEQIPWDDLAFPTVRWALEAHRELGDSPLGVPFTNPPGEGEGGSPK
jgi:ADP-ribose pyrophosphatase YjhB (NUDIX family)